MLGDKRFIRSLKLRNLLSYGETASEFELQSLNVLIGPNASGKSNLIDALTLLQAAPSKITDAILSGGGIFEWLWKGSRGHPIAEIEAVVSLNWNPTPRNPVRYRLCFTRHGQEFELVEELLEDAQNQDVINSDFSHYYRFQNGRADISAYQSPDDLGAGAQRHTRHLGQDKLDLRRSVLSTRRDPDLYPEIFELAESFGKMRFYRGWDVSRHAALRQPQPTDKQGEFLEEDAANYALILHQLRNRNPTEFLEKWLKVFHRGIENIDFEILGTSLQVFLRESEPRSSVPATRISDGTLRYLCLLAILLHPNPPRLICIEEPELGLHPDVIPTIAELLVEASHRTQLLVTTHSDILVSALVDVPESVVVCEKGGDGSSLRRLDQNQLKEWLEKYSLGELWLMGEIGGTAP